MSRAGSGWSDEREVFAHRREQSFSAGGWTRRRRQIMTSSAERIGPGHAISATSPRSSAAATASRGTRPKPAPAATKPAMASMLPASAASFGPPRPASVKAVSTMAR